MSFTTEGAGEVDEFAAFLERSLVQAREQAQKADLIAREASENSARATYKENAIRQAVEAYKQGMSLSVPRKDDDADPIVKPTGGVIIR